MTQRNVVQTLPEEGPGALWLGVVLGILTASRFDTKDDIRAIPLACSCLITMIGRVMDADEARAQAHGIQALLMRSYVADSGQTTPLHTKRSPSHAFLCCCCCANFSG